MSSAHCWAHLDGGAWRCPDYVEPPGKRSPTAGCGTGDEQGTPLWLFDLLNREFRFDCDMFASHQNALCSTYHTITHRWHAQSPGRVLWANPPYSRQAICQAMAAVYEAAILGRTVVTLTRLEVGADWWGAIESAASEVRLLEARPKFRGQPNSYNFPCAVAVFRGVRIAPTPHYYPWMVRKHRPRGAI